MVLMECVDEKFTSIIDQVETKGYLKIMQFIYVKLNIILI